ncbi:hypothetical protein FHS31_000371 [Sphingomonas vulcanisoli]|uniref:Aminopeptidase n=1 Tax=Sphingomonas vulcanisoli TaxID=1658060 RepID=A0ABX0TMN9_9SPHN|nr:M1 family metallopeptidase [Sphingomonas vulcanisoli]NIJ06789.1 hypothetical protein [Sphingomonas vulcanisoli]
MRSLLLACLCTVSTAAIAADSDPAAPKGLLPDAATPSAYRLTFTIDPDQPRFSGHAEIDATVKAATPKLYMHGRDLHVADVYATVGGKRIPAHYAQVDPTGVVRLDFPQPLPAGKVTLTFDYDAAFGDTAAGLYRIKVADSWYSWTQFESIDARSAFPGFDQPGYKTPFEIKVLTTPANIVVSNAREVSSKSVAGAKPMTLHTFESTKPLPTYLVALVTGPFLHPTSSIPADPQRAAPLPLGAVATKAQAGKTDYVLAETPRIVQLLEDYFGQPFPFPKLDQIGSPIMPGAMENAGADIYGDGIILLDANASTRQKQSFGMVVAHELAHQWFGDLVSPVWWEDIWLNESFANWMGYRIGNAWRPELNIGVNAVNEAFTAMNTDALEVGRPIHQPITQNNRIDAAFDTITYGKGGQVIAMIAAYLGDEKFRDGVRLHISRHMYGNASTTDFFQALADAARDPRIVPAMQSFVDQQGVPVVTFARQGGTLVATQKRYAFLGSNPAPLHWTIPLCMRQGDAKSCRLLDKDSIAVPATGGVIMPNLNGQGYYRFDLAPADWRALIASSASLSGSEALAMDDSLWADFRAGTVPASSLITAAKTMAANPESNASVDAVARFGYLRSHGIIPEGAMGDYRKLMAGIYGPRLAALGFDPAAGAFRSDDPDRQKLRDSLVSAMANDAHDPAIRAKLAAAGDAYLGGDKKALSPTFLGTALAVIVERDGLPRAKTLMEAALSSEDAIFRSAALRAVAASGRPEVADWLLSFDDKRLRVPERLTLVRGIVDSPKTREKGMAWVTANYDRLAASNGIFFGSRLPEMFAVECSAQAADAIEAGFGPKVAKLGFGELSFRRMVENVRHCGALKEAKKAEVAAALKAAVS